MESTQGPPAVHAKVLIACIRCKSRKRRCDGGTPKCANCVANDAECTYAAVRRTRGPGRRTKKLESSQELFSQTDQSNASVTSVTEGLTAPRQPGEENVVGLPFSQSVPTRSFQAQDKSNNSIPIVPEFLLPESFNEHFKVLKRTATETISTRNFTPLMPHHISRRLIQNSYADIMANNQLLTLSELLELIDAQYIASRHEPADDPARWAIVNSVIALGIRVKTAPGSEAALSDIVLGHYQNAIKVIPDLILQIPSLLSVQALLTMAMFARDIPDARAVTMLINNASCQLRSLASNQTDQLYKVTNVLSAWANE